MCISKRELNYRIINLQEMCMDYEVRISKLEKAMKPAKKTAKKGAK